ncbi:hypothetical protein [Burkholderia pseudomallei]|uniref:hypothetical protein n=1 Tax=Burkholderia pseudomallei TaxID=28450 RepID=UPI00211642FA|nr:hypothetical protein [Burkholderia pseudomallei]
MNAHGTADGSILLFLMPDRVQAQTSDNVILLSQLTAQVRANSLKIDQSALAYSSGRRVIFYGNPSLVEFLSESGVPRWTHHIDV